MLNFAIIGCGGMAGGHADKLKAAEGVSVVALCDTAPANTAQFKEKYFPEAKEYSDLADLLKNPPAKLDGAVIVTPHTLHAAQCKMTLEAGVNVLVEKPMVTSLPDAYDLWRTVKKTGKLLAIGYQSPYSAEFQYLAKARDAGELGTFQLISGFLSQSWLKGTTGSWRQDPALSGGGQMYDSGAHLLNAMMFLANEPVVEVACFYDTCGSPVDINGVAVAKFASGLMGSICIGGNCPDFYNDLQIQTDTMRIATDIYGQGLEMRGPRSRRIYPAVEMPADPNAATPIGNFLAAIRGEAELKSPVRYGVLLSALMDAMYQSAEQRKPVSVEPVPAELSA